MNLNEMSDADILRIATPMMDELIAGSTEVDWEKHTRHHTERAKRVITAEELERQCAFYQRRFGHFAERECLGITKHADYVNVLHKQRMSESPNEYLAVLSLVEQDGRTLVERCWVDLWEPADDEHADENG